MMYSVLVYKELLEGPKGVLSQRTVNGDLDKYI